jgi:hypothetical protein
MVRKIQIPRRIASLKNRKNIRRASTSMDSFCDRIGAFWLSLVVWVLRKLIIADGGAAREVVAPRRISSWDLEGSK